ncbi:RHS repeat-associated core domain-containing protein [Flavobacterium limi]|uniref:RHS repeat-associated core domain-containing protein n=1 Tax=Flavobacterium limi TaxID=2045105 RepID=A0ABQ1U5A9_9FLAO|nr:RHS repeat-associated core domain-containing protein [Flavobacterium limi]GGF10728.1 hypothetical protein GCM10011518_19910 [Flavobacterium limi]
MKHYLFTYFSLLFINLSFSQQILNKAETVSRTVSDPKTIILSNGFTANSAITGSFTATIGASSDPFSSGGTTNSTAGESNLSGEVGTGNFHDTKGTIAVGGDGQLQFTLPIALPPSINGVAPQMNLFYTSGSGIGIAGMGFSLSGITSIRRLGKNIEKDGDSKAVQLDYTDFYEFNGQKLLLKTPGDETTYGKDGTEYVTEKFSTLKIKSVGSITGEVYKGPQSFEITFDNGAQAWYGTTNESRTPMEYNLVKWKDAQGNYITYNYTKNNNVSLITSVQWGGNESVVTEHFNSIVFNYTTRDYKEVSYIYGAKFLQDKLLANIVVNANGNQFKKYIINYIKDDNNTNYQYVDKIIEYNSQNQAANPVSFEYQKSSNSNWDSREFLDNTSNKVVGDFDGDGTIDYLQYHDQYSTCLNRSRPEGWCLEWITIPKGLTFSKSYLGDKIEQNVPMGLSTLTKEDLNKAVAVTFRNSNGEISSRQGILVRKLIPIPDSFKKDLLLEVYAIEDGVVKLQTSKTIPGEMYDEAMQYFEQPYEDSMDAYYSITRDTWIKSMMPLDVDGDGISEVVILGTKRYYQDIRHANDQYETTNNEENFSIIVDLSPTTTPENSFLITSLYNQIEKGKIGDFNGNSKSDILNFYSNGSPYLTEFYREKTTQKLNYTYKHFPLTTINGLRDNAVLGDFNGDKKTDLMVPVALGNPVSVMGMQGNYKADALSGDWRLYLSTGDGFKEEYKPGLGKWYPSQVLQLSNVGALRRINYKAIDLDKDGKSEFVQFDYYIIDSKLSAGRKTETNIKVFRNNGASSTIDVNFTNLYNYSFSNPGELYDYGEMVGDFLMNEINNNILLLGTNRLDNSKGLMYTFNLYDTSKTARINTIKQGNISTVINYKELNSQSDPDFYSTSKKEKYPFVELENVSQFFVVSQLTQLDRKQDFKYRGLLAHVNGRGMIGFRKSARSNWYASGFENTKIWSGLEIDPLLSGSVIKEWSTRQDSDVFPTDVSVNNSQLLSFKFLEYTTDKSAATGVETIVPYRSTEKDFLKNRTETATMTYGDFNLIKKIETNINNGFAKMTSNTTYLDNASGTGKDYYVGRIKEKEDIVTVYGDTKKSKTAYTYENGLPKTITTFNQDYSKSVTDTYSYDGYGNVTEKTKTNDKDSQTQSVKNEYDAKGLFVIKTTDNLGLITQTTTNDWGQVLTQTDPLGNVLTNTYDGWGKMTKSKHNLTGTTTYTYQKQGDDIIATEYSPTGNIKETHTNKKGEQYLVKTKGFESGSYIAKQVEYDAVGRKIRESELYDQAETPKWNVFSYDDSVFPAKVTVTGFNGKIIETEVTGLTTKVKESNGYNRTNRKTTDVLGNVTESEDTGGIIKFTYNAAGQNTSAAYGQNNVITKYDLWGRKSEFTDPSNGTYRYEYDGFGQLLKEISPKGTKEYTYDTQGKLITQKELSTGDSGKTTNKIISFIYNASGMITDKKGTANGKSYLTYMTYDANGRVLTTSEDSNGKLFFKKNISYDDKGRVISYDKGLYSSGQMTQTTLENIYSAWNGALYQIKDKNTGKVLWQLNKVNANGQVLKANLGAVTIENKYDTNNFLTSVAHTSSVQPNVLQMTYAFDAIKNELKNRSRKGGIAVDEVFTYDDNNRLKSWTNPKTGLLSSNTYDDKGRIVENDQTGTTTFRTDNIYQADTQLLNAVGVQNYDDNIPQFITYNENNDPIYIDGQKGDAQFSYGLTKMRQMVTYGGNFIEDKQGKFTKYYSEDGSYEITTDNTTGKEKHVLYIGTPYDSDIIYVKNYADANAKYLFLHKDYLGSILAISDEAGNLVEQRHFDAWGTLTNGALSILDRGYTSHEHFTELGIIHMNGRLYDPLQRRFLNADENIQDPYNTQCYNKYGYVTNNPLLYNDPSGEIFGLGEGLLAAVIIGAMIGTASYMIGVTAAIMNGADASLSLSGMLKSAFWGAVSGAVTFGIGSCFTVAATGANTAFASSLQSAKFLVQAAAHGVAQGALAMMKSGGAGFLSGAAGGFFGSLGASGWSAGAGKFANSTVGTIAFGALSGGVGAELTGGNFWQGAVTGGIVAGLNHVLHSRPNKSLIKKLNEDLDKEFGNEGNGKAPANQETLNRLMKLRTFKALNKVAGGKVQVDFKDSSWAPDGSSAQYMTLRESKNETYTGSDDGFINIYRSAFTTYRGTAEKLVHEFGHAISRYTGFFANSFNYYKDWNKSIALDEVFAYQFQDRFGFSFYQPNSNLYLVGLQRALNKL